MTGAVADVVVVGGGISGTAAAYELARAGARVTLLERSGLASMASGRTLAGVRQSGRLPAELPLAMEAVRRWPQLGDELGAYPIEPFRFERFAERTGSGQVAAATLHG